MKKKGFTLVELLVAIGIIATLTAILLPNFMGARERAKDAQVKENLTSMKNGLRMFYNDYQRYPDSSVEIETIAIPTYMPNMAGVGYTYTVANGGESFQLCTKLEAANSQDITESHNRCKLNNTVCGVGVSTLSTSQLYVVCTN